MSLRSLMESVANTLQRPLPSFDSAHGVLQTFNVVWTNYPCSCQQADARVELLYNQRNVFNVTTVYFDLDPGAKVNDIMTITDRTGCTNTYLVQGEFQSSFGRGRVWQVHCTLIQQPS